jgi:hypothetical protein
MPTIPSELVDSRVTRLTGASESYAVDVDQDIDGKNRAKIKGKTVEVIDGATNESGAITVGTLAVEVKLGLTKLANRCCVTVQPTNGPVWWSFKPTVTTLTGTKIFPWEKISFAVADNVAIYLISDAAGRDVRISEGTWQP